MAPHEIISAKVAELENLSDAEVLTALRDIPPLADETDACWGDLEYWNRVAYPYLALWDVAANRKLGAAIPLILGRACFGDPGEIMRNMRHTLEAIAHPDWSVLTKYCVDALSSPRPGTRFWAADQLQVLRDPAIPPLEQAAQDPMTDV